ncbi:MAG: Crp/Fnr family transcriptional regulator [Candidatus Aminicenantales bacterium]
MKNLFEKILALGIKKKYPKKSLLFSAGEETHGFFFIRTGEVRVFKMDKNARELELVRLWPGDFFGEAAVFAADEFPAFAEATKDTEVIYFEKEAFVRRLRESPDLALFFIQLLARKCLILNERIEALSLRTVRQRLAQYLLSHCSGQMACLIELKIRKGELARLLSTASETLSRNLRELQEEGVIEVRGQSIRVKDCLRFRQEIAC